MEHKLIPVYRGDAVAAYAIVDDADFGHLSQWTWQLTDRGYARRRLWFQGREYDRYMHRIVADVPDESDLLGDHINGNRLDNRRENLRIVFKEQNAQNRFAQAGKLGGVRYKGVYAHRNTSTFSARIRIDGRTLYLGSFPSQEDAAKIYDKAALEHFGEHAKLNFPITDVPSALAPDLRPADNSNDLTKISNAA